MTSSSSCSPASSVVTIPIPGKSIFKRPPPTQTGILNRIKGFLPNQPTVHVSEDTTSATRPCSVDLSGVQLTPTAAAILLDVFDIEWGLRNLTLRECDLDDSKLKPVLHALLIPGTLEYLSVASNRRLKPSAFKLIGCYWDDRPRAYNSSAVLDKKAVDYIVACLPTAPEPGLISLRLDDYSLRPNALEVLARVVRTSSLRNISLRHNKITATGGGAVAIALMIRDYPDVAPASGASTPASPSSVASPISTTSMSLLPSPLPSTAHLPPSTRTGPMPPPPRHPSALRPQTTYTPYIPRSKRAAVTAALPSNPLSATGQPVPIITSNSHGGVTTRHPAPGPTKTEGGVGVNGVLVRVWLCWIGCAL